MNKRNLHLSARRARRVTKAVARRAALRQAPVAVPRPLVVAYENGIGLAVVSGEFLSPLAPPLYTICMVHPCGSVAAVDLEFVSPEIGVVQGCLSRAFVPDGLAVHLVAVCDLLPPDLSNTDPCDVGCLDLALKVDAPLTGGQQSALLRARKVVEAGLSSFRSVVGQVQ